MKKVQLIYILLSIGFWNVGNAQEFAIGSTAKTELYSHFTNPDAESDPHRSSGSALVNLGFGPKIWLGTKAVSLSAEANVIFSPFAFNLKEYHGLGALSFPILAKLNFGGLSTFQKSGKPGFAVGFGIQYNRTELFGVDEEEPPIERGYYRTYIVQAGGGFGLSGFAAELFGRYGWNGDGGRNFSIGISYDFNAKKLKKYTDPEF